MRGGEIYLPLYEAKMIWQFDHRYASYQGVDSGSSTHLPEAGAAQHADPGYQVLPWYWVAEGEVAARLGRWKRRWLLGFRDITNATNERTVIVSVLTEVGVGHSMHLLFEAVNPIPRVACLLSNLNSAVLDYVARQKVGGMHLTYGYLCQFVILDPRAYLSTQLSFIVPRVLELTYTAWDLKPFGDDVWAEADAGLRAALTAQREENARATGGHTWESAPAWVDRATGFPPFRWDAGRRALLRAELDACYARLYGLTRDELRYVLDPQDVYGPDSPGQTFRVLKEKEGRE